MCVCVSENPCQVEHGHVYEFGAFSEREHVCMCVFLCDRVHIIIMMRCTGGWKRIFWSLDSIDNVTILQGRMLQLYDAHDFAQLTVQFDTIQRFCAYDKSGKVVSGDEEQSLKVRDVWVFERAFIQQVDDVSTSWMVAGRMPQFSQATPIVTTSMSSNTHASTEASPSSSSSSSAS